ncbi:SSS family solute:Na+ symporter [Bacillus ectoiniformans]|uniref:sodium:solute symporter family protein n=1 Tax=Bacillus ectoiniformans TaxID=1494429 RepID=UPI00195B09DD|nr:sodium:solute symporter family protein [Bacillus ectoiniformans]MBM7647671.1 SSS family solute:Na+ symporter [Bacillus ectoiniformans]
MSKLVIICLTTAFILGISSLVSIFLGRRTKNNADWSVGGRSLPLYVVIGTQYATAMGGGVLVAHVGIGYQSGWSVLTYGFIVAAGLLLFTLLAPWLRAQNFSSLPEVFAKIYGENKLLYLLVSLACIIVPLGWISTQLVAFSKLFSAITGLNSVFLIVLAGIVSVLFVMPAGLTSVAWTDFIFGCFMLIMSIVTAVYAIKSGGGWNNITDTVPAENISFPEGLGAVGSLSIVLWILSIIPGTLTNQLYYQRIFAIKKANHVRTSLIISAIVFMTSELWAGVVGQAIRAMQPGLAPEEAAGWFLTQMPTWLLALYAGFIAATVISTIDSAIQSAVVNLNNDIYKKLINPEASDRKLLNLSRLLSVIVTFIAGVFALVWPEALGWLVASYAYSASVLLFPLMLGYAFRNSNFLTTQGVISSMAAGIVTCGIGQAMNGEVLGVSLPYVVFGLAGSLVTLLLVSSLTKNNNTLINKEQLEA